MGQFRVEWDDFSGGYFVGPNDADQPRNTWTGVGMAVSADQAMLMPAAPVVDITGNISGSPGLRTWTTNEAFMLQGAPIVCSGLFNSGAVVVEIITWVTQEATTYDMEIRAVANGLVISTVVAGTSGDYRYPTARPVALPTTADFRKVGVYFPVERNVASALTQFIYEYLPFDGTATATSIPVRLSVVDRWKEWLVAAKHNTNRLHFSGPLAPTSWSADDYVEIGDNAPITAIVPMANQLWIGKQQGWYVVTGVLGESTIVRAIDSQIGPAAPAAEATEYGVIFTRSDRGVTMLAQKGLQSAVVNHRAPASRLVEYHAPVDVLAGTIIAGGGPQAASAHFDSWPLTIPSYYAWVLTGRRWHVIPLPALSDATGATADGGFMWAKDYEHIKGAALEPGTFLLMKDGTGGGGDDIAVKLYRHQLHITDPVVSVSATATLSEWKRQNSGSGPLWFTVREAIAELEVPPSQAASFSVAAVMRGVPDRTDTGTSYPTSPETVSISSNAARRQMTFRVAIGSSLGNGVEPVVTLTGCKLRRLTLVCDDAGAP
jgi:hypothetical protein